MKLIAGEKIVAGDWIVVGNDGKAYRCKSFKGKIPPIAEKEKRGKRVKIPKNEPYVQSLEQIQQAWENVNVELNIPSSN